MSSGGDDAETSVDEFELFVRLSSGNRLRLRGNNVVSADSSVGAVKAAIASLMPDAPPGSQRLIYKGRILDDDSASLETFGIVHQSTLFLVLSRAPETSSSAVASSTRTTATPSTIAAAATPTLASTAAAPTAPTSLSSDRLQQLLQSAMMAPQQPSTRQPPLSQQQRSVPGNPGSIDPLMQRLMRDMDPNFLATMMQTQLESNPALQRLMDENPHLRHMMTDPSALQQAANMLRNPEAMQQAMRQQDLALSQLENMPGGFAALSSMYQNMQVPLEESLAGPNHRPDAAAASAASAASSASQYSDEGAAGTAMPNPWGSPPARPGGGRTSINPLLGSRNPFLEGLMASSRGGSTGAPPMPALSSLSAAAPSSSSRHLSATNNPWANLGGTSDGQSGTSPANRAPSIPPPPQLSALSALGGGVPGGAGANDPLFRAALQLARDHPDQLRELIMSDPSHRAMFGDNMSPEMFNQLLDMALDPNVLEMMSQFEGFRGANPPGGFPPFPPAGDFSALLNAARNHSDVAGPPRPEGGAGLDFSTLLQGMMGGAPGNPSGFGAPLGRPRLPVPSSPAESRHPRDRYRRQLQQLADMGFDHEDSCVAALQAEHGNLNRAVDRLLSSPPAAPPPPPPDASRPMTVDSSEEPSPSTGGGADEPPAAPKDAMDKKND